MRNDEGRSERESQDFFLAFEMGHFLDSRSSDFWCPVFLKGGKNEKNCMDYAYEFCSGFSG